MLSTQVARPLVEIFFGRLDARTATNGETDDLMQRFFPGGYELVEPGVRSVEGQWPGREPEGERPVRIAYCVEEERGALRLFMRALRRLPEALDWEAAIWVPDRPDVRISKRLRERVNVVGPRRWIAEELVAAADISVRCLRRAANGPGSGPRGARLGHGAGRFAAAPV